MARNTGSVYRYRLIALNARSPGLSVVADHPGNVAALAAAASPDCPLGVFVDIDPGIRRTGVASDAAAVDLARQIDAAPGLTYQGVQKYCGREQHIESYAERKAAIVAQTEALCADGGGPAAPRGHRRRHGDPSHRPGAWCVH